MIITIICLSLLVVFLLAVNIRLVGTIRSHKSEIAEWIKICDERKELIEEAFEEWGKVALINRGLVQRLSRYESGWDEPSQANKKEVLQ